MTIDFYVTRNEDSEGDWQVSYAPPPAKVMDTQVGGDHYRKVNNMQPWDIIDSWELDFYEGNVVKYVLRAKHKGSQLEDYQKAKHYLERLIEKHEDNT